ncbi:MAG: GNAT family N-acetyltransferase [Pseudomonadota bacterium]
MSDMITTDRLTLRPYKDADADVLMDGFNDFDVVKWLANPPFPFTRSDVRLTRPDGSSRWPDVAAIDHDGVMIGSISRVPHFGFWLLRAVWNRGFASEAGRAMIQDFFETSQNTRLESGYFEGNAASARVLEKLGFKQTGRGLHRCQPQQQDLPYVGLALTRRDWEIASY